MRLVSLTRVWCWITRKHSWAMRARGRGPEVLCRRCDVPLKDVLARAMARR